jgi:hypothetical protein
MKKLDYLSPPISLFFKEEGQHSSIFSGILSCIAYILVFIAGVYYSLEFINKTNPKAYFFNRYINDAGTFPVNSSAIFHFILIADSISNKAIPFDFSVFTAIGVDNAYADDYMNNPNIISNIDHWVYGNCNNSTDTLGIEYLINFTYYEQSACIRKYYNKEKNKYYNTYDTEFRWPIIEKGCSNPTRTYYGIIMQRCDAIPDILKQFVPECKTDSEIREHINKVSLKFHLIDHYADMLNYQMPFTKYFYELTSAINDGVFRVNHLNFNPANMLTHNGIFFDRQIEERSYFFVQNEKNTFDHSNLQANQTINGCLIGIYFWMQNSLQYYERNYDRLQDVLSDIGGISSIVVTAAYFINLLVNNYIILIDIENFVLSTDQNNFQKKVDMRHKPTILKKANDILYPPRRNVSYQRKNVYNEEPQEQSSSNYQKLMKDGIDIYQNNFKIKEEKIEENEQNYQNQNENIYPKRSHIITNNFRQKSRGNTKNTFHNSRIYTRDKQTFTKRNALTRQNDNKIDLSYMIPSINKKEEDSETIHMNKQNFTWPKYILYLICCGKNDPKISYYETFRAKLISEENIIQNYLDIYRLLKVNNIPKKGFI